MENYLDVFADVSTVASIWGAGAYSTYRCRRGLRKMLSAISGWARFLLAAYVQAILKFVVEPAWVFCQQVKGSYTALVEHHLAGLTPADVLMIASVALSNEYGLETS